MGTGSRYRSQRKDRANNVRSGMFDITKLPGYIPPGAALPGAGLAAGGVSNSRIPNAGGFTQDLSGITPLSPEDTRQWAGDMDYARSPQRDTDNAIIRFLKGLKKNGDGRGNGDPAGELSLDSIFSQYPDVSGSIRDSYGAQEAAINAAYDAQLASMERNHGAAEAGVRDEGAQLQSALGALGADARTQMQAANRNIRQDYARERGALKGAEAHLARDLGNAGASTSGLGSEADARRAAISQAGASQEALGKRYSQLLGQEINNRKATGRTVTTASLGDLARILAQARDSSGIEKAGAIGKLRAGMASDLASAEVDRAKARYSLYLDVFKGNGDAGSKPMTPSQFNSAQTAAAKGVIEWDGAFKPLKGLKSDNPELDSETANLGLQFREQIENADNPAKAAKEAWAAWSKDPRKATMPRVTESLLNALTLGREFAQTTAARNAILREAGLVP